MFASLPQGSDGIVAAEEQIALVGDVFTLLTSRRSPHAMTRRRSEMTFDDPKTYTRGRSRFHVPHSLLADCDIFEMFPKNEKDCAHRQR